MGNLRQVVEATVCPPSPLCHTLSIYYKSSVDAFLSAQYLCCMFSKQNPGYRTVGLLGVNFIFFNHVILKIVYC